MSAPERRRVVLGSETHRQFVGSLVATSPPGCVVTIDPPRRSIDQNNRLHAMLSEICESGFALEGRRLTVDELKTAFVSGWMIENGHGSDIIKGFNGEPVQLRRSTTTFDKAELGSLMDYIEAECALRGIPIGDGNGSHETGTRRAEMQATR